MASRPFDVPPSQSLPRPVIATGILAAAVTTLRESFEGALRQMSLSEMYIDIANPQREAGYPSIVVSLGSLTVDASGLYASDVTDYLPYDTEPVDRDFVLRSRGTISLKVLSLNPMEALEIQDHITQIYHFGYLFDEPFHLPGATKDYIAIMYEPGTIQWSPFSEVSHLELPDSLDRSYQVTADMTFMAEHSLTYSMNRISAIEVEGIPYGTLSAHITE